jgi:hypothetical protein
VSTFVAKATQKLGRALTTEEQRTLGALHNSNTFYDLDDAISIAVHKAAPVAVSGATTVLEQETGDPQQGQKQTVDVRDGTTTTFSGEKALARFRTYVQLPNAGPGVRVGYLQVLRFSNREVLAGSFTTGPFRMANVRDGAEANAPWIVPPIAAGNGPVVIEMKDEPAQWGPSGSTDVVSARGVDLFSTWLVSTSVATPRSLDDVQILYHWDWTIDWTKKRCAVDGAGGGLGGYRPVFVGEGARKRYNDFLQNPPAASDDDERFSEGLAHLKAGVANKVATAELDDTMSDLERLWPGLDADTQEHFRGSLITVLDEYCMKYQARRPAQAALGGEFGFKGL